MLKPCVAYAPVDLNGQVGVVVGISPEVYELVRLVLQLTGCLCPEYGGRLRHPPRASTHDLSLGLQFSETKYRGAPLELKTRMLKPCVAYAPVDLNGQVGVVVGISPEVYELVRLVLQLTGCLCPEYGGRLRHPPRASTHDLSLGLQFSETKYRGHDHDHAHPLPQLLRRLQDDSGIISVKHASKRRRRDWLSSGCFPPPSHPHFLPQIPDTSDTPKSVP